MKELDKDAVDELSKAFAHLVSVTINSSASPFDAIPKISPIIYAMQTALMRCVLEADENRKGATDGSK